MRDGLMTGERIERPSASGLRPGVGLRPSIVVTVKFEGIARDQVTGVLSLRDAKIAVVRSDKSASEADTGRPTENLFAPTCWVSTERGPAAIEQCPTVGADHRLSGRFRLSRNNPASAE